MANRVKVLIYNSEYAIISNEKPEYVRDLASRLDDTLKQLMSADGNMSLTKALVLCSMSFLDDQQKSEANMESLHEQIKEYLEDAVAARAEADSLRRELANLKKENQQLKSQLLESSMPDSYRNMSL